MSRSLVFHSNNCGQGHCLYRLPVLFIAWQLAVFPDDFIERKSDDTKNDSEKDDFHLDTSVHINLLYFNRLCE